MPPVWGVLKAFLLRTSVCLATRIITHWYRVETVPTATVRLFFCAHERFRRHLELRVLLRI